MKAESQIDQLAPNKREGKKSDLIVMCIQFENKVFNIYKTSPFPKRQSLEANISVL